MNFSALGGITVLVVAVIWFFVYIPAWTQSAQRRDEDRAQVREARRVETARRERSSVQAVAADRIYSLNRRVRFGGTLASISFLAVIVGLAFIQVENAWMALPAGILFFAVGVRVMRRASFERHSLAEQSLNRRTRQTSSVIGWSLGLAEDVPNSTDEVVVDPRAWTPNEMPAPMNMLRVGEIENVKLAEVLPIQQSQQTVLEPEKLDEILRRRRAIG